MSENTTRSSVDESSDNEYKLVVAGSRSFTEDMSDERAYKLCCSAIARLPVRPTEIVSGGARGADTVGEKVAREHNIDLAVFEPDWDEHGRAAGPIRNQQMAEYADGVLAIWDCESRGTQSMIECAMDEIGATWTWVLDYPNSPRENGEIRWIQTKPAIEGEPGDSFPERFLANHMHHSPPQ
jgi:hypothetical protein